MYTCKDILTHSNICIYTYIGTYTHAYNISNYFPGNNEFGPVRIFAPQKCQSLETSKYLKVFHSGTDLKETETCLLFLDNSQPLGFISRLILMPKASCATELASATLESC